MTDAPSKIERIAVAHPDGLHRCPWPGQDAAYLAYHDEEWGVPERDSRALFEKLLLDGFQAGLSWISILRKRENFRAAFDGFDPGKIAAYDAAKVESLMADAGIIRNRAKIAGAVVSARLYLEIEATQGFSSYHLGFRRRAADRQSFPGDGGGSGRHALVGKTVQGPEKARLQILRPDHHLRLHAGRRHGQRSSRRIATGTTACQRF